MSKFAPFDAELKALIAKTTKLKAALAGKAPAWGLPPDPSAEPGFTCLRLEALDSINGKEGGYFCNLNLWTHNKKMSALLDMAEELQDALNGSSCIIAGGYSQRTEKDANITRALWRIEFYV
jgi:hypothetical protein